MIFDLMMKFYFELSIIMRLWNSWVWSQFVGLLAEYKSLLQPKLCNSKSTPVCRKHPSIIINDTLRLPTGPRTMWSSNYKSIDEYTGGTVRAKKLSLKCLALSGLFGTKFFVKKQSNRPNSKSENFHFISSKGNIFFVSM